MNREEILQLYMEEAHELLNEWSNGLIALENDPSDQGMIGDIFRCVHTLKGSSGTVHSVLSDLDPDDGILSHIHHIASLTHGMEDVMMEVRDHGLPLTAERLELLFETAEAVEILLGYIDTHSEEPFDSDALTARLMESMTEGEAAVALPAAPPRSGLRAFRLTLGDEMFKHAYLRLAYLDMEEKYNVLAFHPTVEQLEVGEEFEEVTITLPETVDTEEAVSFLESLENIEEAIPLTEKKPPQTASLPTIHTGDSIRISISRIDEVLKHVSSLVVLKNKLLNHTNENGATDYKVLEDTAQKISQTVEYLQKGVMNIRMTPLDQLFSRFPKDVRRIAKDFGKKVKFETAGGKTEIDKSLLDKLGDPLMHLIRNAVDHGVESPEERERAGKDPVGSITIAAKYEQNKVVISVQDDGKGIDVQHVVQKAIDRGILTAEQATSMPRKELLHLIFHPGLSTAKEVTAVSGRGVGMDVVRAKIADEMKGQIDVETEKGVGTTITIQLPLTLAIIHAMLATIQREVFAFPSSQVEYVEEIRSRDIQTIGNQEVYVLKEHDLEVPIVRLDEFFGLTTERNASETINLLILKSGAKTFGATVDEFIGHEDIVLKTLGNYLGGVPGIGGCHVLGNGEVSLVVDVHSIAQRL